MEVEQPYFPGFSTSFSGKFDISDLFSQAGFNLFACFIAHVRLNDVLFPLFAESDFESEKFRIAPSDVNNSRFPVKHQGAGVLSSHYVTAISVRSACSLVLQRIRKSSAYLTIYISFSRVFRPGTLCIDSCRIFSVSVVFRYRVALPLAFYPMVKFIQHHICQ